MTQELEQQLSAIALETLTPIVGKAVEDDSVEVLDWSFSRLPGEAINPITAGIYRFSGTAQSHGQALPWSMILKVIQWVDFTGTPLENGYLNKPADWNYWKREALAYQSGILEKIQGHLVPVKCFHTSEPTETSVWIWQEEIKEPNRSNWTPDRHILAARHFGEFGGVHVGFSPSVNDNPWICRQFIRQWTQGLANIGINELIGNSDFWNHHFVTLALPAINAKRLQSLMKDADGFCKILEKQPQTLSHQDTHWPNLFATKAVNGKKQTIVIDWSFLGLAAVGEDLGTQIAGNLSNYFVNPLEAGVYYEKAFHAYIDGLSQAGWHANENSVRFACNATAALRYATFEIMMLKWLIDDKAEGKESWIDEMARKQNLPVDKTLINWGKGITFLFDLADEARDLASQL